MGDTREFINYGDVNPIEHGGIWVKQVNETDFEIARNIPDNCEFQDMCVNICDSWIDRTGVMNFIGMIEEDFNPVQFAIGCIYYYGVENFGSYFNYESEQQLQELLNSRGIK